MNLVDDLNRNITAEDYHNIVRSFIAKFSNPSLSLYLYGSNELPRSDLDFLILVHPAFPVKHLRKLYHEMLLFIRLDAVHGYAFPHPVFFCPSELISPIRNYNLLTFWPKSLRLIAGPLVDFPTPPPPSREAKGIFLLNTLLFRLEDLNKFLTGELRGLRRFLSLIHKIGHFTFPWIRDLNPTVDFGNFMEGIASWNRCAWQSSFKLAKHREGIEDFARKLHGFMRNCRDFLCAPFLQSVLNFPKGRPEDPESLIPYFKASYLKAVQSPSLFQKRLAFLSRDIPDSFEIVNEEYGRILKNQMEIVEKIENIFSKKYKISSTPLFLAGLCHVTSLPARSWRTYIPKFIRQALRPAYRRMGSFLKRS